jgi:hypothetical protein
MLPPVILLVTYRPDSMTQGDAADVIDNSDQGNDAAESHAAK